MPTIEIDRKELDELVGRELPDSKLESYLPDIKCEVEEIGDESVKIEVTFDRIDLLSVEGVSRALRNYLGESNDEYSVKDPILDIKVSEVESRPHIAVGVVKGVELTRKSIDSLMQLQEKLHGSHGRERRRVAIGLHDLSRVEPPFSYTEASPDQASFIPLGGNKEMSLKQILLDHEKGKKYSHLLENYEKYPIITDSNGHVLSFPPIINGRRTEVTERTEDIFIDVTGTDEKAVEDALNVMVAALADRGGEVYGVNLEYKGGKIITPKFEPVVKEADIEEMEELVGIELDEKNIVEYLEKLGYDVAAGRGKFKAEAPFYRSDILSKVDVAEDIAMGYGYNNIEPLIPNLQTHSEEESLERKIGDVRDLAAGLGYQEVLTPVLSSEEIINDSMRREKESLVRLENPVSENYEVARDILLPQVVMLLSKNTHSEYPQKVFEVGEVILKDEEKSEKTRCDRKLIGATASIESNYTRVRGELEGIFQSLGIEGDYEFEKMDKPFFIQGRSAQVIYKEEPIGFIGEVHPECLNFYGLEVPVAAFEINLERFK